LVEARQANPVLPLDLLFRPALGSVALIRWIGKNDPT
jgi:hypothetical protein